MVWCHFRLEAPESHPGHGHQYCPHWWPHSLTPGPSWSLGDDSFPFKSGVPGLDSSWAPLAAPAQSLAVDTASMWEELKWGTPDSLASHMRTHTLTLTHTCAHTRTHMHTHACAHTHMHAHTHAHMHAHMLTHMCMHTHSGDTGLKSLLGLKFPFIPLSQLWGIISLQSGICSPKSKGGLFQAEERKGH